MQCQLKEDQMPPLFYHRRSFLKSAGAAAAVTSSLGGARFAQAQSSEPIRIGFQKHATGIGAAYGRWYDITTQAAAQRINDMGGINGRELEIITEDDGTDPGRGADVLDKFANEHKVDVAFGTLFSHVVTGTAPRAAELKLPYFVVSEGNQVANGALNRYTFQPGTTNVRSQAASMAPFVAQNLGRKVTMIFPDYEFGHQHRDHFSRAIVDQGGEVVAQIPIPPTETNFNPYFQEIPSDTEVVYHVMVGPAVLSFVKQLGEFFGPARPEFFGFIDSLEAVDLRTSGLQFLEDTYMWEGFPRHVQPRALAFDQVFRDAVGVNERGASLRNPSDVSTYSHMFGCWETLNVIKAAMEEANYQAPKDRAKLIEALEDMSYFSESEDHPQGDKLFDGKRHQSYGRQFISKVTEGRLDVVHETSIEDGLYDVDTDYTKQKL
jgi:branched-chain amino acid transport system substrate-binding protein